MEIAKNVNTKTYLIEISELFKKLKIPKDETFANIEIQKGFLAVRITTEKYMVGNLK